MIEDREKKVRKMVEAILDLADSNFPSSTTIKIEAVGPSYGMISLTSYELRAMLKEEDRDER